MIWQIGMVCIIHLDENNKLSVDFDYAPHGWKVALDQLLVWTRYKFLFEPRNERASEQFKAAGSLSAGT